MSKGTGDLGGKYIHGIAREDRNFDENFAEIKDSLLESRDANGDISYIVNGNTLRFGYTRGSGALSTKEYQELFTALGVNTKIENVFLQGIRLDTARITPLVSALEQPNSKVSRLYLTDNDIDARGAAVLSGLLGKRDCKLEVLGIGQNQFGNAGVQAISGAVSRNTSLKALGLGYSGLNKTGIAPLAEALSSNSSIEMLFLQGNKRIGETSSRHLANMLNENSTIHTLYLNDCTIKDAGASIIFDSLKRNTGLKTLNLAGTTMGDTAAASFAATLGRNAALEDVDLSRTRITDRGAESLIAALREGKNTTMQSINVEGTAVTKPVADRLEAALQRNRTLKSSAQEAKLEEVGKAVDDALSSGNKHQAEAALKIIEDQLKQQSLADSIQRDLGGNASATQAKAPTQVRTASSGSRSEAEIARDRVAALREKFEGKKKGSAGTRFDEVSESKYSDDSEDYKSGEKESSSKNHSYVPNRGGIARSESMAAPKSSSLNSDIGRLGEFKPSHLGVKRDGVDTNAVKDVDIEQKKAGLSATSEIKKAGVDADAVKDVDVDERTKQLFDSKRPSVSVRTAGNVEDDLKGAEMTVKQRLALMNAQKTGNTGQGGGRK